MEYKDQNKICQNCKKDFIIESDDFSFYEKIKVPAPTFCPECRMQRRLAWRNDFTFYNRECGLCQRKIISVYSPNNPQVIYCNTCWWSDRWSAKDFAQDFDFSMPFFQQFAEFRQKIPALALVNDNGIGSVNCEYTQDVANSKNCYMTMVAWKIENCMYFSYGADAKDAVDCMGIFTPSGGIYENIYSGKCFNTRYVYNSLSLIDCAFCYDCYSCADCFQCAGLRNKKYCFRNDQYSKEEYEKIMGEYKLDTFSGSERAFAEFEIFLKSQPHKFAHLHNCLQCTGTNLIDSKNSKDTFHVIRSENCKYMENGDTEKDSYDISVGGELSECYEGLTPDHSNRALFVNYVWTGADVLYSDFCISSQSCFGCIGLKHAKYSIFNKQYSKEEYEIFKNKIIEHMKRSGEWGEFFPMKYSPFAYNETMAHVSFPLTKEEVLRQGLNWQDNIQQTRGRTTLFQIPDSIFDVEDSITKEILECNLCNRNYKITSDELIFYKKWKIPIPRKCFNCRLERRFKVRGPSKLWKRQCDCNKTGHLNHANGARCKIEFETSYSPDRPEIVYCEKCYQQEVY